MANGTISIDFNKKFELFIFFDAVQQLNVDQ